MACANLFFQKGGTIGGAISLFTADITVNVIPAQVSITATVHNASAFVGAAQLLFYWAVRSGSGLALHGFSEPAYLQATGPNPTSAQFVPSGGTWPISVLWQPDQAARNAIGDSADPNHILIVAQIISIDTAGGASPPVAFPADLSWPGQAIDSGTLFTSNSMVAGARINVASL